MDLKIIGDLLGLQAALEEQGLDQCAGSVSGAIAEISRLYSVLENGCNLGLTPDECRAVLSQHERNQTEE